VRSTESEVVAVEQLIEIRRRAKNALYFCHVSSADGLKLIAEEKEKTEQVFCEVTPHHLFLTEKSLEKLRNFGKVNPPRRKEKDRLALLKGLKSGVVDV
ncbi:MAG: dihydroorotase family protein, partial [Patescibacteria group bacterium]